jgi:hypothetical protein
MRAFAEKHNQPQQKSSASLTRSNRLAASAGHETHPLLHLQRTIGNRATLRLLEARANRLRAGSGNEVRATTEVRSGSSTTTRLADDFSRIPGHAPAPTIIQPKLAVNTPGDSYEQEADRLAEQVMRTPEPQVQRACACGGGCPSCQTEQPTQERARVQTKHVGSGDSGQTAAPPIVHKVLASPGQPLDASTRSFMEPRFGYDFAKVCIHMDNRAAESAAAVKALAYTAGEHIILGAAQYAPGSLDGQRLLAHELAHVVQQNRGQAQPGEFTARHDISHAPDGLISRKEPPPSKEDAAKKLEDQKNEDLKKDKVKWHITQLSVAADLLDKARKLVPDPKKGVRDPDNLFHNTVELLDRGKLTLTILSPTHWSPKVNFDSRVRFDSQVSRPTIVPDYPSHVMNTDAGSVIDHTESFGMVKRPPAPGISTMPPKVERAPGETAPAPPKTPAASPPSFSPGDVVLFTRDIPITEGRFKNTFVHEAQHVSDLSALKPKVSAGIDKLEQYKSEFRAFWIQPPVPRTNEFDILAIDRLPEPTGKAENSYKVSATNCTVCAAPDPKAKTTAYVKPETGMKNARQEDIFWHLMTKYIDQQFDCCYLYNAEFHKGVDEFAYPESVNLINSDRLMNLNLELQTLQKGMDVEKFKKTKFYVAIGKLETLDWVFLNDRKLSDSFWKALEQAAPKFLLDGMKALSPRGAKRLVSAPEIDNALSGKL